MNICLHQDEPKGDTMTETAAIYQAGAPVTQWHCHQCKNVLGIITDGRCRPVHVHDVILGYNMPTIVVCSNCGKEEPWYSGWDKREG